MLCPKCGRELREGEVCSCSSGLPDGKAVLEGVKSAARAVKNSPFIAEILYTARGVFTAPEKQVADNAERIDILWALLIPIEAALNAFGFTAVIRRTFFAAAKALGAASESSAFANALSVVGLGAFKMFGANFLWAAACIVVCIIAAFLFSAVCKKKKSFSEAANLMTTVLMPSSALMAAAGIGAFAYAPLGLLLAAAAGMSALLLGYRASEAAGGKRAFWLYIISASAVLAVCAAMEIGLLGVLVGGAFGAPL